MAAVSTINQRVSDRSLRGYALAKYSLLMQKIARPLSDLSSSAVVFAPHPDDETLGCGGMILRKNQVGARVQIVFMTDGSQSHAGFLAPSELAQLRQVEARAAGKALGVDEDDLFFLGFPDGELKKHQAAARVRVAAILEATHPAEIFIPYHSDSTSDHFATSRIVLSALKGLDARNKWGVKIYEYPVWFWYHWPWVQLRQNTRRETKEVLLQTAHMLLGLRGITAFSHYLNIQSVLQQKKMALEQHHTQMMRPDDAEAWPILQDVGKGNFLACFFQSYEYYYTYLFKE